MIVEYFEIPEGWGEMYGGWHYNTQSYIRGGEKKKLDWHKAIMQLGIRR